MAGKVGPCGGDGGEPFSLDNITRIVQIVVYYNTYISAIAITYMVDDHKKTVTWGEPSVYIGKKKNEVENKTCYPILPGPFEQITLETGEYITSVKGYYSRTPKDSWNGLRALIFETSSKITYGPYGIEVGTKFELPAINGKINGFHGLSDATGLAALGVYIYEVE